MISSSSKIHFAKVKEGAIIPSKKTEDAGYDIYACFDEDFIMFNPHQTILVPTGIASAFSSKYVAILKERGSTGTKGIGQRCGVIDSGFRGEWKVPITNHNNIPLVIAKKDADLSHLSTDYIIYPYEKAICQAILTYALDLEVEENTYEDLLKFTSERGTGMLGSSGK